MNILFCVMMIMLVGSRDVRHCVITHDEWVIDGKLRCDDLEDADR